MIHILFLVGLLIGGSSVSGVIHAADTDTVNPQITDAVTQTDTKTETEKKEPTMVNGQVTDAVESEKKGDEKRSETADEKAKN